MMLPTSPTHLAAMRGASHHRHQTFDFGDSSGQTMNQMGGYYINNPSPESPSQWTNSPQSHSDWSDGNIHSKEARQVQVCFQASDEDPPRPREGRGGEPYREQDHHTGPLRNPWQVHLEACLSLHSLWKSHPKMLLKLKVLIVLPS